MKLNIKSQISQNPICFNDRKKDVVIKFILGETLKPSHNFLTKNINENISRFICV
jgi:hypothetical protein